MPPHQALQHVVLRRENVPHIVKHRKPESAPQVRERNLGKAQFQIVDEQSRASHRKARKRVTGTCLIQPESPMGVAAPCKKLLRERYRGRGFAGRLT